MSARWTRTHRARARRHQSGRELRRCRTPCARFTALDEARGYCLDVAGPPENLRLDDPLQAHTCK